MDWSSYIQDQEPGSLEDKWPFSQPVPNDPCSFHCTVCNKPVSCGHQGERDLIRHSESAQYKRFVEGLKHTQRLSFGASEAVLLKEKIARAEVKVTNLLAQHNVPIAVSDHLSPLLKDIFPDSTIAKGYSCARTKTTSIINGCLGPHFKSALVCEMQKEPFSVAIDGSNDNGVEKMNPLTVRFFNSKSGMVETQLLDMCTTTGVRSGTAECIFSKMNEVLEEYTVSWDNCVGLSVDNTSLNIGNRNSIMTRVLQKNPSVYVMGCPCHIVHNMAGKGAEAFMEVCSFDVKEVMIDNFYYFDKSTKCKGLLCEYYQFCDVEYRKIIKHVSTRWLSLEAAVDRTLRQYAGLKSYFLSEEETSPRFSRLATVYSNPMSEVYLLFYQSALQLFKNMNMFLQREDPIIPVVLDQLQSFVKNLLGKFVKLAEVRNAGSDLGSVQYGSQNQLRDKDLHIGFVTRQKLQRLLDEGDIDPEDVRKFYKAVRRFYCACTNYAFANLPIEDVVLQSSRFVNFGQRGNAVFSQVEFFVARYPTILQFEVGQLNSLEEEFLDYQLMDEQEIPNTIWDAALISQDDNHRYHRLDVLWSYLSSAKNPDGMPRFSNLATVAKLVLVIPHSNTEEERVFSMVRKNKTAFRPNLKVDGTLQNLLTVKLANPEPCHKYEPPKSVLTAAKKLTMLYNKAHSQNDKV